jgi:Flp pilus assembly protein TadG
VKSLKNQKGASAVEFAMLLPVLVALVFGIIEVGLLLYNQQVLTNASREGARAAIQGNCASRLTDDDIEDIVEGYCAGRLVTLGAPSGEFNVNITPERCMDDGSGLGVGDVVAVSAQYNYTFLVPSILGFDPVRVLSATTVMKMESEP